MHTNCVTCCNGSDEQWTKKMQENIVEQTQDIPVGTVSTFGKRPLITASAQPDKMGTAVLGLS